MPPMPPMPPSLFLSRLRGLFAFAVLLCAPGGGCLAAEPAPLPSLRPPELIFEAPAGLEPLARQLGSLGTGGFTASMRLLGLREPGPPIRVILAKEGSDLAKNVPPWISGYALGDASVVVLLPARTPRYPGSSLTELLNHEVAHVLIARAAGGLAVPRFWHEGLAMIAGSAAAGGEGDWGLEDRARFTLASLSGKELTPSDLDRLFAGGPGEVAAAYAISFAFAEDVRQRWGAGAPAAILAGVASGLPFGSAFRQVTGTELAVAEANFVRDKTLWYRWVPILTSSFTLWMGILLLAFWARGRRRAKTHTLHRLWAAEEEARLLALSALEEEAEEPVDTTLPGGRRVILQPTLQDNETIH